VHHHEILEKEYSTIIQKEGRRKILQVSWEVFMSSFSVAI
jgi:hypothetical protein